MRRGRSELMPRTKKPKVQIKREKTSLGWAYRIYVNGMYMGTGLTQEDARQAVTRMLAIYERTVPGVIDPCPLLQSLLGVKRTWVVALHESAFDHAQLAF